MLLSESFKYEQSKTLVRNISRYVRQSCAKSLLDIGPGLTASAIPLSETVNEYVGVEEDESRAIALVKAGLDVVFGKFPLPLSRTFDFVLASHSVPEHDLAAYDAFCGGATSALNPGGVFLAVTFKGSQGDAALLREEITGRKNGPDPQFSAIVNNIEKVGLVRIEKVNSHLQSKRVEDLVEWLSNGWLLRTGEERKLYTFCLQEILETRYNLDGMFIFPLEHLFISVSKFGSTGM